MTEKSKVVIPPYAAYKSFQNFIEKMREYLPSHITRTVLPGSNSAKAAMFASLRSFNLIDDEDVPTHDMKQLADPSNDYHETLEQLLKKRYSFLFDDTIDLTSTTTEKVAEKFKEEGASGSTVAKCMTFFLNAANDVGIEVSPYVKVPQIIRAPRKKKIAPKAPEPKPGSDEPSKSINTVDNNNDKERIVVSVHGMDDWVIYVPKGLSEAQWKHGLKMAMFNLENYRTFEEGQEDDQ